MAHRTRGGQRGHQSLQIANNKLLAANVLGDNKNARTAQAKRPLESNLEDGQAAKRKRTAFGDITNAVLKEKENGKKVAKKTQKGKKKEVLLLPKVTSTTTTTALDDKDLSLELIELSQGSSVSNSQGSTLGSQQEIPDIVDDASIDGENAKNIRLSQQSPKKEADPGKDSETWVDIDAPNINDVCQVGLYAADIFDYYKEREEKFLVADYMTWQKDLSQNMRAILVDWLVEVQENFELNHETLYLGVKLVDHYLSHEKVARDRLQLVGASSLFIACKFDERCPPVLDDFLYICDDAYTREDLIKMEQCILRAIDFDLGFPLSYRFLRRYSKCAQAPMETLTLARYILETSLMWYQYTQMHDSKVAAAALLLALRMKDTGKWNPTLVHYTGYQEKDLLPAVQKLNTMISTNSNKQLQTIRSKYAHKVFSEVAKIPPLNSEELALEVDAATEKENAST